MNAAERLRQEYQQKLKQLQETCPHEEKTDWLEEWWAPGHGTGRRVRACANCNKILEAKRCCAVCGHQFLEANLQPGDGHVLPLGASYCAACHARERAKAKTSTHFERD